VLAAQAVIFLQPPPTYAYRQPQPTQSPTKHLDFLLMRQVPVTPINLMACTSPSLTIAKSQEASTAHGTGASSERKPLTPRRRASSYRTIRRQSNVRRHSGGLEAEAIYVKVLSRSGSSYPVNGRADGSARSTSSSQNSSAALTGWRIMETSTLMRASIAPGEHYQPFGTHALMSPAS